MKYAILICKLVIIAIVLLGCSDDTSGPEQPQPKKGWAKSAGGADEDMGLGVATDGSGNVLVTGYFRGSADFGDTTLTSAGEDDVFMAKYDAADGSVLWVRSASGVGEGGGAGVATDASGNVLVTGWLSGSADFGGTMLTSAGEGDVFVAKYDAAGDVLWAKSAGGPDGVSGYGVATDASGNVLVIGNFSGTADFGDTTLTSAGENDVFVAKYDPAGDVLWAKSAGGADGVSGYGVAIDASGNVLVIGIFSGTADFGATTLTSADVADVFVAKYDPAGNVVWAKSAGGAEPDLGNGVTTDGSGNVFVTGAFEGSADFGGTTLTSAGEIDIFVVKMGPNGFE